MEFPFGLAYGYEGFALCAMSSMPILSCERRWTRSAQRKWKLHHFFGWICTLEIIQASALQWSLMAARIAKAMDRPLFSQVYGVDLKQATWYSGLPWEIIAGLVFIAGMYSDFLIASSLTVTTVQKIMQVKVSRF